MSITMEEHYKALVTTLIAVEKVIGEHPQGIDGEALSAVLNCRFNLMINAPKINEAMGGTSLTIPKTQVRLPGIG